VAIVGAVVAGEACPANLLDGWSGRRLRRGGPVHVRRKSCGAGALDAGLAAALLGGGLDRRSAEVVEAAVRISHQAAVLALRAEERPGLLAPAPRVSLRGRARGVGQGEVAAGHLRLPGTSVRSIADWNRPSSASRASIPERAAQRREHAVGGGRLVVSSRLPPATVGAWPTRRDPLEANR